MEEFSILFYNYWMLNKFNLSLSTIFINLFVLNLFFIYLIVPFKYYFIPTEFQFLKEEFFRNILIFLKDKNISIRSIKFFIFYINLFFFILWSNLSALMHFGQSITSQIIITLFLSLTSFFSLIFIGFLLYKVFFYKIVEPEDVPRILFFFIFIIEFFSFIIRPFSLAIRLFANMLAGHMLLVLITIFILFICKYWIIVAPVLLSTILLSLTLLEIVICFIQTYVFVVLFLTYMDQVYSLWTK